MTTRKPKAAGPKIAKDPDNKNTVILDRWPTKEEKEQFAKDVRKARRAGG